MAEVSHGDTSRQSGERAGSKDRHFLGIVKENLTPDQWERTARSIRRSKQGQLRRLGSKTTTTITGSPDQDNDQVRREFKLRKIEKVTKNVYKGIIITHYYSGGKEKKRTTRIGTKIATDAYLRLAKQLDRIEREEREAKTAVAAARTEDDIKSMRRTVKRIESRTRGEKPVVRFIANGADGTLHTATRERGVPLITRFHTAKIGERRLRWFDPGKEFRKLRKLYGEKEAMLRREALGVTADDLRESILLTRDIPVGRRISRREERVRWWRHRTVYGGLLPDGRWAEVRKRGRLGKYSAVVGEGHEVRRFRAGTDSYGRPVYQNVVGRYEPADVRRVFWQVPLKLDTYSV